jgi:YD repeat-containing protein
MRTTLLIGGLWLGAAGTASAQTFAQVTFEYDEVGRLLRERGADGRVVAAHAYDLVGNRTSTTDALGHTTRYVHDALDRVVEVEDALGGRTRLSYDGNDRLTQVVDPRGLTTRYVVDGHGRTLREISPDRGETTYTHNADGQLARMKRANGTWLDYTYDSAGRVKTEGNGTEVRQFTYDTCQNGKGRFCSVTVNGNSTTVTYAPHGELASRLDRTEGQTATTHYFHDKAGRLTGLQYPHGCTSTSATRAASCARSTRRSAARWCRWRLRFAMRRSVAWRVDLRQWLGAHGESRRRWSASPASVRAMPRGRGRA